MEKPSGDSSVRTEIAIIAGPKDWGDTRESWLARVPRKVSTVSFRTVKALWYGEIQDADHWAARDIRRAAEAIQAQRAAATLADKYQSIAGALRVQDPEFHQPQIDRLEYVIRRLGAVANARAGAQRDN